MNTETSASLTASYLAQLEQEARRLPVDQAADLLADIRDHLSTAVAESDSEAHTREVLDRLGSPRAVVDGALADAGATAAPTAPTPPPAAPAPQGGVGPYVDRLEGAVQNARQPGVWGGFETAALICLLGAEVGFLLVPLAGIAWLAGLVLLGISKVWNTREKTLGYLGIASGFPVGVLVLILGTLAAPFALFGTAMSKVCSFGVTEGSPNGDLSGFDSGSDPVCHQTSTTSGGDWLLYIAIAAGVCFLAFQVYAIVTLLRARRRTPAGA